MVNLQVELLGRGEEESWLPSPQATVCLRATEDLTDDDALNAGLAAYHRRDFPAAVMLFQRATGSGALEPYRKAYLADVLMRSHRFPEALPLLQELSISDLPDPWRETTWWNLFLCLLAEDQRDRANSLLRELAERPDRIGTKARHVLEWLRDPGETT